MDNLENSLVKSAKMIVDALVKALGKHGLSDSNLAKNIKYKLGKNIIIIDIPEYGKYVDSGSKPHMPPVDAIRPWAEARGLNAWGVAMNIKKNGVKPKPFLFAIDEIMKSVDKEIIEGFGKDLDTTVDEMIKQNFKK